MSNTNNPRLKLTWAQKLACLIWKWAFRLDIEMSLRRILWHGMNIGRHEARENQLSTCNCGLKLVEVRQGRYDCPQCFIPEPEPQYTPSGLMHMPIPNISKTGTLTRQWVKEVGRNDTQQIKNVSLKNANNGFVYGNGRQV